MTNFELITQNEITLDDFISAIVDDALEAKGCSLDLKLPYSLQDQDQNGIGIGWQDWLTQEAKEDSIILPHNVCIERWIKYGRTDG